MNIQQIEKEIVKRRKSKRKGWSFSFFYYVGWLGPLFPFCIYLWANYAYIFLFCKVLLEEGVILEGFIYLALYTFLMAIVLTCFAQCIFKSPGEVPIVPYGLKYLELMESRPMDKSLEKDVFKNLTSVKLCHKCFVVKPKRCHHCSTCDKCVLKMDHHCILIPFYPLLNILLNQTLLEKQGPWINNCVGFYNQKSFNLFLFYVVLLCLEVFLTGMRGFRAYFDIIAGRGLWTEVNVMMVIVVGGVFAFGLFFFALMHFYQTISNGTTIDKFFKGESSKYDVGKLANWKQVMGEDPLLWFVPVSNQKGDGTRFPSKLTNL